MKKYGGPGRRSVRARASSSKTSAAKSKLPEIIDLSLDIKSEAGNDQDQDGDQNRNEDGNQDQDQDHGSETNGDHYEEPHDVYAAPSSSLPSDDVFVGGNSSSSSSQHAVAAEGSKKRSVTATGRAQRGGKGGGKKASSAATRVQTTRKKQQVTRTSGVAAKGKGVAGSAKAVLKAKIGSTARKSDSAATLASASEMLAKFKLSIDKMSSKALEDLANEHKTNLMTAGDVGSLNAALTDDTGQHALRIYKANYHAWGNVTGRLLDLYDNAERLVQEGRSHVANENGKADNAGNADIDAEVVAMLGQWDDDGRGMSDVLASGLEVSRQVVERFLVDRPTAVASDNPPVVVGEKIPAAAATRTEAHELAKELFASGSLADGGRSCDDEGGSGREKQLWGSVARGQLKTWVGVLKGAQEYGVVFGDEGDEDDEMMMDA